MPGTASSPPPSPLDPRVLSERDRYQLLTSLVVPRPIGWISTRPPLGVPNLAPFSFFAALSSTPFLVGASIGARKGEPKDTLENIRAAGAFCVNLCSEDLLEAMNASSAEVPAEVDEFALAGVTPVDGDVVKAPRVLEAPASLECTLFREVRLGESPNTLVIGEVRRIHLAERLSLLPGTFLVDPWSLKPVARLGGDRYALLREVRDLPRPSVR